MAQFDVEADERTSELRQTTVFDPARYVGRAYWCMLYPVHHTIFGALLHGRRRVVTSPREVLGTWQRPL
ncbi:MAG: DUF2867 domain-containing protein [Actinomycetota bacterium]|nr:DUF2867 domain-containing protein [Actinomycetota bacterium]